MECPGCRAALSCARPCPQCGDAMGEHGDAVRIDVCPAHGTFYDAGELAQILAPLIERGLEDG